jgi:hypothetical protein
MLIWMVLTALLSLYSLIDILYRIRLFLLKRQFKLEWFAYIEYTTLILCINLILIWNTVFGKGAIELTLPMSEQDFNTFSSYAELIDSYAVQAGIVSLLLITKNLKALTSKFPSFGLLFETINQAGTDLLYFSIMTLSIALSCTVVTYCLFGPDTESNSTMGYSAFSILSLAFGFDLFPEL